jgi:hypothetical protein
VFDIIFSQFQIVARMLTISSRKSKAIKLLYFKCSHNPDEDFVTIKYRFTNAVSYRLGNLKTTSRSIRIKTTAEPQKIKMCVYGFFRKNEYIINLKGNDACITRVVQVAEREHNRRNFPPLLIPSA